MKKVFSVILFIFLICFMAGCQSEPEAPTMYIQKAQLTEAEENIVKLLGDENDQLIYDFVLDDTVQCLQINTYELQGSEWKLISGGGGQAFTDPKGRLALDFNSLAEGLRVAIQSEHSGGSNAYRRDDVDDLGTIGRATSMLSDKTEIVYEQEIPLVTQILSSKAEIVSYQPDYYFQPEEYAKLGYEKVYAITIRFSQKSVSEQEPAWEDVPEQPAEPAEDAENSPSILQERYVDAADLVAPDTHAETSSSFDDRTIVLEDSIDNQLEQIVYQWYHSLCSADFDKHGALIGENKALKQTNEAEKRQFGEGVYMTEYVIHALNTLQAEDMGLLPDYVREDIEEKIGEYGLETIALVQADISWKHNEKSLSLGPQIGDGRYFRYYLLATTPDSPQFKCYEVFWEMYNELELRDDSATQNASL